MADALVIGRAGRVWEEVAAARTFGTDFDYILVGSTGVDWPDTLHHWVSFHVDGFPIWRKQRESNGHSPAERYWTADYRGTRIGRRLEDTRVLPNLSRVKCRGGSSGLVATFVGLELYDRVVLCGVPMDAEAGQYDTGKVWKEAKQYRQAWLEVLPQLRDCVRSMSGWTQELLGGPDKEWLS